MLGKNINRIRKEKRYSVCEIADLAGISRQSLSCIEAGKVDPKVSTVLAIASALDVPIGFFFANESKLTLHSRKKKEAI